MSLIRQIWLLLLGTLLLAFLGSFGVWMASSQGYLETQLRMKNADNAQALALNLSQQKGDATAMELAVMAMFDTGYYQRITLKDAAGKVVFSHVSDPALVRQAAPSWFVGWLPVVSAPGVAQVSDGWRALGSVEVVSHSSFAHDQLWAGALKTAGWLALLGGVSGILATFGVRGIRQPLDATVNQAQALMERRFITVKEPRVPELARLSQAMNGVVMRLKALFDEQATQVELLRKQAHCDPLTGLSHRAHFMNQLVSALHDEEGVGTGVLYFLRVGDLQGLNHSLGHVQTDVLLQKLGAALKAASQPSEGACVGRLNGGDFAVCLQGAQALQPVTAEVFAQACHEVLRAEGGEASFVLGGVTWKRGMLEHQVLAAADSALARAEARGPFSIELGDTDDTSAMVMGEDAWRLSLTEALSERRVRLVAFPLVDRLGRLVHQECPMRIQIERDGAHEVASTWLPMALRSTLMSEIDEMAVRLALESMARDRVPRGVNLSPASLLDSGFVPRVRALLLASPKEARLLSLEVAEGAAVDRFELVRELCKQLRPLGARIGLEHAGERLTRIEFLFEAGLDYVKLDASVVQGVCQDGARAAFVQATAGMLHGLGLQVYAEGVSDLADIPVLHRLGVDGVTGPVVKM
ncbi:MAG: EAL domain-containing protein [Aquabacterium sp.]|jgi:EAL domain-containing protein (putative c-di-GMP-specific phosphodiesterase class I)/GGDEF domain-containing protein|uniref:bifunctional diguanylate cyclase/phosphodiesterase n=1 Tax=Aquabacterium sp. TaxID=1872578 RepID=UPI001B5FE8C1|nr:EAL domain-containing protein [Aquabacterium sp.]MBP7132038.1 EAL domain-containing protein [Aquabacterium sp.]MBP9062186.1 EAL domain-containing protein [Aquabacterium sp.]